MPVIDVEKRSARVRKIEGSCFTPLTTLEAVSWWSSSPAINSELTLGENLEDNADPGGAGTWDKSELANSAILIINVDCFQEETRSGKANSPLCNVLALES